MSAEQTRTRFRYPEEDTYASIDSFAVLSLICGLLSTLAIIFNPIFLFFGVLGITVGLASLLRIQRSEGTLSGSLVAKVSVALALFSTCYYLGHSTARDSRISGQAREFAEHWLSLIQDGKYPEAHQLTRTFFDRELPGTDLAEVYSPKKKLVPKSPQELMQAATDLSGTPYEQMEDFFRQPTMKILRDKGKNCKIRFVRNVDHWQKGSRVDYVEQEFELEYEENGKPVKRPFTVTMLREHYKGIYGAQWAVDMVDDEEVKIDRHRQRN